MRFMSASTRPPASGTDARGRRAPERLVQHPVDVVVGAEAPLFLHHLALALRASVVDEQRGHPIRLEIEHQRQRLGGEVLVVGGQVVRGVRVRGAARGLQPAVELLRPVLLRAVEHHVLEEVADAGDPGPLVARADAEEAVERADRQAAIREQPDLQPVLKRVLLDGKVLLESGISPRRDGREASS
jgi:hypothetical protein